jgi:hypothetical protein
MSSLDKAENEMMAGKNIVDVVVSISTSHNYSSMHCRNGCTDLWPTQWDFMQRIFWHGFVQPIS